MAIVVRKIFNATGTREPNSPSTASANAISVAVGMAQPFFSDTKSLLIHQKIAAGTINPPSAASAGIKTWSSRDSCPSTTSRLSSRPTSMKNSTISASLIHSNSGLSTPRPPSVMVSCSPRNHSYISLADGILANRSATTVVTISRMPPAVSSLRNSCRLLTACFEAVLIIGGQFVP